ncbi:MAG: hypothetical protein QXP36_07590 [Conexivisphaerales archaeon]
MKYFTLPVLQPSFSASSYNILHYTNQTNSFALIVSYFHNYVGMGYLVSSGSPPYKNDTMIAIKDQYGNMIGLISEYSLEVNLVQGSTTVWNGTSMETEPSQMPAVSQFHRQFLPSLIPPQSSIWISVLTTIAYQGIFGGFGFILEENELKEVVKK